MRREVPALKPGSLSDKWQALLRKVIGLSPCKESVLHDCSQSLGIWPSNRSHPEKFLLSDMFPITLTDSENMWMAVWHIPISKIRQWWSGNVDWTEKLDLKNHQERENDFMMKKGIKYEYDREKWDITEVMVELQLTLHKSRINSNMSIQHREAM